MPNPDELLAGARQARTEAAELVARMREIAGAKPLALVERLIDAAESLADRFGQLDEHMRSGAYPPAGWPPSDEIHGDDVTAGAGPDATCGCGERITMYDGVWLHVFNPELRGTDDHDAHPDSDLHDEEDLPEPVEYDPGPEADDEGGMSEFRHELPGDPF